MQNSLNSERIEDDTPLKLRPLLRGTIVKLLPPKRFNENGKAPFIGQLSVWCPFCKKHHLHGWQTRNNGRVIEPRSPHCDNPLNYPIGYAVSVWRKQDIEYSNHVITPGWVVFCQLGAE